MPGCGITRIVPSVRPWIQISYLETFDEFRDAKRTSQQALQLRMSDLLCTSGDVDDDMGKELWLNRSVQQEASGTEVG